jgi:hypothetical protein
VTSVASLEEESDSLASSAYGTAHLVIAYESGLVRPGWFY